MANKPVEIVQLAGDAGKYRSKFRCPQLTGEKFHGRAFYCGGSGTGNSLFRQD